MQNIYSVCHNQQFVTDDYTLADGATGAVNNSIV